MEHQRSTDIVVESKFSKWLDAKVLATASIIGIIFTVFNYFANPINELKLQQALIEQRLETLQNNHLSHITDDIKELKADNSNEEQKIAELQSDMTKVLVILEELKSMKQ